MSLDQDPDLLRPTSPNRERFGTDLRIGGLSPLVQYGLCLTAVATATLVAEGFDLYAQIPNLSLIYVVPVVAASVVFGLAPALFCALLGALCFNFFFTEPRFTLEVADTSNIWAIVLLFVIGCITSAVASRSHHTFDDLKEHRRVAAEINGLATRLTDLQTADQAIQLTGETLERLFSRSVTMVRLSQPSHILEIVSGELQTGDREAAEFAAANQTPLVAGVYPFIRSRYDFHPTLLPSNRTLIVGVAFDVDRRPPDAAALISIAASLLAAKLTRIDAEDRP